MRSVICDAQQPELDASVRRTAWSSRGMNGTGGDDRSALKFGEGGEVRWPLKRRNHKVKAKISRYTKNKVLFSVPCAYVREKAHGGMMFCFSWGKSADSEKPRGLVRSLLS